MCVSLSHLPILAPVYKPLEYIIDVLAGVTRAENVQLRQYCTREKL